MKQIFTLFKNQWEIIKKYGLKEEIIRVRTKMARPVKDLIFGKDWFQKGAKEDLQIIKKIFEDKDIKFFLIWGTCLGAVREGNFIEHDDDIDLGVIEETPSKKRQEVCEAIRQAGFKIIAFTNYQSCTWIMCERKVETSICWFQKEGDNFIWRNGEREGRVDVQIPSYLFARFKEVDLAGNRYLIPDPPEPYLERAYPDWRTPLKKAATTVLIKK